MRSVDVDTYNALRDAPEQGFEERNLLTVYARELDGVGGQMFCFWNDLDIVDIYVMGGQTGTTELRSFVGDGAILKMGRIQLTSDLTIRTVKVTLSQIHSTVLNMARGFDIRGARAEIHRVLFNPQTGAVIAQALPHFVGKVNRAPTDTPPTGGEGNMDLEIVSTTRELTRTSPAKKSDETQKRRQNDRARRYTGTANVDVWWAKEKGKSG